MISLTNRKLNITRLMLTFALHFVYTFHDYLNRVLTLHYLGAVAWGRLLGGGCVKHLHPKQVASAINCYITRTVSQRHVIDAEP